MPGSASFAFWFAVSVCLVVSLVLIVGNRSRMALYRVLINVAVCLLFFLANRDGSLIRDRLFIRHLARFQEVTDTLIANERARASREEFSTSVRLPSGYSDGLNVADTVFVKCTKENRTVEYLVRETSARGHSGYMYRSDDKAVTLEKNYPRIGYTHLAPYWFFFTD